MKRADNHYMVSPAVCAFMRFPPVWIGSIPDARAIEYGPATALNKTVLRDTITDDIQLRVRRDGIFFYDFTKSKIAPHSLIPWVETKPGSQVPKEVTSAENTAEHRIATRSMILNVHQACLSTAETVVHKRSSTLGIPVHPYDMLRPNTIEEDNVHATGRFSPYSLFVQRKLYEIQFSKFESAETRELIEMDTLKYSVKLLSKILEDKSRHRLKIYDLLFQAASSYPERRFSECLILSWAACERMLNSIWDKYLKSKGVGGKRRKKLLGREFTASIVSEIISLSGQIPEELHKEIDNVRRDRNDWIHNLEVVSDQMAARAVRTAERLFFESEGINPFLSLSSESGSTLIPIQSYNRDLSNVIDDI